MELLNRTLLKKKFLVVSLLIVFGFALVNYVLNNSRLEISNTTSEDIVLFIEGDSYQQKLELKPEEKTGFRLKKGSYSVEATGADKQTRYVVSLEPLFKKSFLHVDLKSINKSEFLGENDLQCARKINNKPVFYSCLPSTNGLVESAGAVGLSPLLKEEAASAKQEEEISTTTAKLAIKPYKNVFLEAKKFGSTLFISKRGTTGYLEPAIIKVENFESDISDSVFSVDEINGKYAVVDEKAARIIYGDIELKEQKKIDYSGKDLDPDLHEMTSGVGGEKIYLIAARSNEHIENHSEDEEEEEKNFTPQIVVYEASSGKEQRTVSLEESATIAGVSSGAGGLLYYIPNKETSSGGGAFFLKEGTKTVSFKSFGNGANPPCWTDKNSFYYISAGGDFIYRYYLDKGAAYLVYQNNSAQSFISNISCSNQSLYFSIASQADEKINVFNHYKLSDEIQSGRPAEEVLPKYFEVNDAAFKASLSGDNKISIELIYNYEPGKVINQERVRRFLVDELKFEGVNLQNLTIEYSD